MKKEREGRRQICIKKKSVGTLEVGLREKTHQRERRRQRERRCRRERKKRDGGERRGK